MYELCDISKLAFPCLALSYKCMHSIFEVWACVRHVIRNHPDHFHSHVSMNRHVSLLTTLYSAECLALISNESKLGLAGWEINCIDSSLQMHNCDICQKGNMDGLDLLEVFHPHLQKKREIKSLALLFGCLGSLALGQFGPG